MIKKWRKHCSGADLLLKLGLGLRHAPAPLSECCTPRLALDFLECDTPACRFQSASYLPAILPLTSNAPQGRPILSGA